MENQPPVIQKDQIRYYFVLLLDILGQKEQLKKWEQLSPDLAVTAKMREGLQNSLGRVLALRKGFLKFFGSMEEGSKASGIRKSIASRLPPGSERDRYRALSRCIPKLLHFSDMLVAYSSAAAGPTGDWNIMGLARMLGSVCCLIPSLLELRIPIRGGICIGTAVEADDIGFYGPALAEAHYLESEVAGYPRIVVSPALRDFIRSQPPENNGPVDQYVRLGFELCQSMIADDTDGWTVVDYLGNGSRNLLAGNNLLAQAQRQAVAQATTFVADECQRLTLAATAEPSETMAKLAARYSRLQHYFDGRKSVW